MIAPPLFRYREGASTFLLYNITGASTCQERNEKMPSQKPSIFIRTDKEIIEEFKTIAASEGKSMSVLGEQLIKEYIEKKQKENK